MIGAMIDNQWAIERPHRVDAELEVVPFGYLVTNRAAVRYKSMPVARLAGGVGE